MQSSQFPYNFMSGKGKGKDATPPEPENIPQALLSAFQRFFFLIETLVPPFFIEKLTW